MSKEAAIRFRTLTPIWTGGASGRPDRLHETGLIGSLRFWYEVIARSVVGSVCDPAGDDWHQFDTRAYESARRAGKSDDEALQEGTQRLCPVCFLFGATGWRRLFQLQVHPALTDAHRPLHFRTTVSMHRNWLGRVFLGEEVTVKRDGKERTEYHLNSNVWYWPDMRQALVLGFRGLEAQYARSQVEGLLSFVGEFGFLGAKPQHGFGQIAPEGLATNWQQAFRELHLRFPSGTRGTTSAIPFSLDRAVFCSFEAPEENLRPFLADRSHFGPPSMKSERRYVPCAFDLRYKSQIDNKPVGLRIWLKAKGWKESSKENALEELDKLLGPRSEWGRGRSKKKIQEDLRTGSRVFFGMPVLKEGSNSNTYSLRVIAFLPHDLPKCKSVKDLADLVKEYMSDALPGCMETARTFGRDLVAAVTGESI